MQRLRFLFKHKKIFSLHLLSRRVCYAKNLSSNMSRKRKIDLLNWLQKPNTSDNIQDKKRYEFILFFYYIIFHLLY